MTDPQPYDHVRATTDADVTGGVYRVVGTDAGTVTLVRVTDDGGRRQNTGEVVTVSRDAIVADFEPAQNPDAGIAVRDLFSPVMTMPKALAYWIRNLFR